ncbi:MAG TPA: hypothetical protein VMU65_03220, partial [Candidatus Saccharimonadales bacterium]|nr:hypothetical protein [Candidatus Saccharimonadales bacterium]
EAAIDALLAELPRTFAVSDWRRAMSPQETLSISIDELAGPFVRLAGSYADDPVSEDSPEWWSADDSSPDLAFGLSDFPLLPGGRPLWAETSPENVNLAERLAELPPSILILTGAKLRAAAVVSGGDLIDAVWIDDEDQARGEAAGMALLGATKGSLAGYALDDPRVADALTMLWRLPLAVRGIEMSWLDPASMLAAFRADGLDRVLVIDAPVRGIALFSRGGLVAVYSETQRSAVASPERLRSLLSQARGRLTVMERKPRPVAAAAATAAPSAADFFGVAPEAPAEVVPEADVPTSEAVETHPYEERSAAEGEIAAAEAAVEPSAATDADAAAERASDAPTDAPASEPTAEADASPPSTYDDEGASVSDGEAAHAETIADGSAPPPPPPPDDEHAPPPPDDEILAEPERKARRPWWAFGSRKKKTAATQALTAESAAAEAVAAREAAEAASFAGWRVRQPDPEAQPVWNRSRDHAEGADDAPDGAEAPPPAAEAVTDAPADENETVSPAPTWSVVEPGAVTPRAISWPSTATAPPAEEGGEAEPSSEAHPETADPQAWSARDVTADSVGRYEPVESVHPEHAEDAPAADEESAHADAGEAAPVDAGEAAHVDAGDHEVAAEVDHSLTAWFHPEQVAPQDAEPAATDEHELVAADDHDAFAGRDELVAATDHESDSASDSEPVAATVDAPADVQEHDPSAYTEPTHDFWAEFASPDPDADTAAEAEPDAAPEEAAEAGSADEPVAEAGSADEPAAEHAYPFMRRPSERTGAPWSWPLAESEPAAAPAPHPSSAALVGETQEPATASAQSESESEPEPEPEEREPVFEGAGESGFFQRDEPVGSQFVDFDEVRTELVQIGIVWLGEANAVPVTALLRKTRSTIDDFVATIDTIRGLHLEGQDPASVQAMAREMHQQAAERLCGA